MEVLQVSRRLCNQRWLVILVTQTVVSEQWVRALSAGLPSPCAHHLRDLTELSLPLLLPLLAQALDKASEEEPHRIL